MNREASPWDEISQTSLQIQQGVFMKKEFFMKRQRQCLLLIVIATSLVLTPAFMPVSAGSPPEREATSQGIPPAVQQLINQAFQSVSQVVIQNAEKINQWKSEALAAAQKTAKDFTGCPSNAAQNLYNNLKNNRASLQQIIAAATVADQQAQAARQTCKNTVPNTATFKTACDVAYNNLPFVGIKVSAQAALNAVNAALNLLKNLKCISGCSKTATLVFPTVSIQPGEPQTVDIRVCSEWEPGQFTFNADSGNGELSASALAKLPKCNATKTFRLAGCEWKLDVLLDNLKRIRLIPPEVQLPQVKLEVPTSSVRYISGFNQSCSQPFKICKQFTSSGTVTFDLGANPIASLQSALQSITGTCTQEITVGCLNPVFGLTPVYSTIQVPDPTKAKITWTDGRLNPGSIMVDITQFRTACTPRPLRIPGPPKIIIGKQVVNFPFLCLQPQFSNLVANQ
jgi:hypothetical protein